MATVTLVVEGALADPSKFREFIVGRVAPTASIEGFKVNPVVRDELAAVRSERSTVTEPTPDGSTTIRGQIREMFWDTDGLPSALNIDDPIHGWVSVAIGDDVTVAYEQ